MGWLIAAIVVVVVVVAVVIIASMLGKRKEPPAGEGAGCENGGDQSVGGATSTCESDKKPKVVSSLVVHVVEPDGTTAVESADATISGPSSGQDVTAADGKVTFADINAGNYQVTARSGSFFPGSGAVSVPAGGTGQITIQLGRHAVLEIEEITFGSNHKIDKDTLGAFRSPEWVKGRAAADQSPVCYTRNKKVKLTAKFKVTTQPSQPDAVAIRGKSTFNGAGGATAALEWTGTVNVNSGDTEVTSSAIESDVVLPNQVDCYDGQTIAWEMNPGNTGWAAAGNSEHLVYVTLADPAGGVKVYWTLVDLTCRSAKGVTTADALVTDSFNQLKTGIGNGNGLKRKRDGQELSYWKLARNTPQIFSTAEMLATTNPNGHGRCGAWQDFTVDMHKIHGITTTVKIGMFTDAMQNHGVDTGFLVKNWKFNGAGTRAAPYTHVAGTPVAAECQMLSNGIPGQGKDNPQKYFWDHAIIQYGGAYYDPSYGAGPIATQHDYEAVAMDGMGAGAQVVLTDSGGFQHFAQELCSRGYRVHIITPADTPAGIAASYAVASWKDLYDHPYNAGYKTRNSVMNTLGVGDFIFVPREISNINMLVFLVI
ncbi:MAG: carboxypeptidase-like regulatory domain-containing protein [bacterium]